MRECCTDHTGKPKKKYPIKEDALEVARNLELEKGIYVKVYQCDERDGWHLTSHDVPQQPGPTNVLNTKVSPRQPKKQKGRTLGKILGKELVEKLKYEVQKRNLEKLKEERK